MGYLTRVAVSQAVVLEKPRVLLPSALGGGLALPSFYGCQTNSGLTADTPQSVIALVYGRVAWPRKV